jgi:hypothetical protein
LTALKVFLIGDPKASWMWELRKAGFRKLPYDHDEVTSIVDADATFLYVDGPIVGRAGIHLGMALAFSVYIGIGGLNADKVTDMPAPRWLAQAFGGSFLEDYKLAIYTGSGPVDSYERAMADLDVTKPTRYRLHNANSRGLCQICGGSYERGHQVRSSVYAGSVHLDCYEKKYNPRNPHETVFNAALVATLRKENAELEKKLRSF